MPTGAIVRNYDRKTHKKCIKCRAWKPRSGEDKAFGDHESSSDGLQSICYKCKNEANVLARGKNVSARLRHHTATRCLTQLGYLAPTNFVANLEDYLGYKISTLSKHLGADLKEREGSKRKLRDALNEGYHVDHIRPLSSFRVIVQKLLRADSDMAVDAVDWKAFRACWATTNLRAIPADENLAKGADYEAEDATVLEGPEEESVSELP